MQYEKELSLNEPLDPLVILSNKENEILKEIPIAIIESENKLHIFKPSIDLRKKRKVPSNPQFNINIGLNLPPNIKPEEIPQKEQQVLQQWINQIGKNIQQVVQQEIMRQSPVVGVDVKIFGGSWKEYEEV